MEYREGIQVYVNGEGQTVKEECTIKTMVRTNMTTGEVTTFHRS